MKSKKLLLLTLRSSVCYPATVHVCGCFCCIKIFKPSKIREWVIQNNDYDRRGTAVCPYCGIDSVIGASSGFPITEEFLTEMNHVWF